MARSRSRPFRILAAVIAGLVLLLVGWIFGNWAACIRANCSFDTALFEALGTWVGGLGTIAALVFAAVQLSADFQERARDRQADELRDRQRIQKAFEEAQYIELQASMNHMSPWEVGTYFKVMVTNAANETPIFNVDVTVPDFGNFRLPRIDAKDSGDDGFDVGDNSGLPEVRITDGREWEAWEAELVDTVTIEFDMNDARWRRKGTGPVHRTGSAEG